MAKIHAKRSQVLHIGNLLSQHLDRVEGEEKLFIYKDGWSDSRIAEEVSITPNGSDPLPKLNPMHVASLRNECFGPLRKDPAEKLDQEAILTRQQIIEVRQRVDLLLDLHAKLCQTLSVNRVADVRHLAGPAALIQRNGGLKP